MKDPNRLVWCLWFVSLAFHEISKVAVKARDLLFIPTPLYTEQYSNPSIVVVLKFFLHIIVRVLLLWTLVEPLIVKFRLVFFSAKKMRRCPFYELRRTPPSPLLPDSNLKGIKQASPTVLCIRVLSGRNSCCGEGQRIAVEPPLMIATFLNDGQQTRWIAAS